MTFKLGGEAPLRATRGAPVGSQQIGGKMKESARKKLIKVKDALLKEAPGHKLMLLGSLALKSLGTSGLVYEREDIKSYD